MIRTKYHNGEERRESRAFPLLIGAVFCVALLSQNATTVTVPSNIIALGEKGLPTPISYGWPVRFVAGHLTDPLSIGFGTPLRYWRHTLLDSVFFLPLLFNVAVGSVMLFAIVRVAINFQARFRPKVTIAGLLGFTVFVSLYLAHVLEFNFSDVESDPWHLKIPLRFESIRIADRVFRLLEGVAWFGVLVACIYTPTAISSYLVGRRSKDCT